MTAPREKLPPTEASLPVIRLALLAGVLAFGAASWFFHRGQLEPIASPASAGALRTAGAAVWALVTVAELVLFFLVRRARDEATVRARKIVAWGLAESVALFGGVYYFQSGDPHWYVYGLVFFLAVLMIFPTRDRA